jgi:hypothetical protein
MKAHTVATLVVRGSALAMFVVGTRDALDLVCMFLYKPYAVRLAVPETLEYNILAIVINFILSFALFILSGHIGQLFSRGLEETENDSQ